MKETTLHQQATTGLCQTSMVIGYDTTVEILTRLDFEQAGRLLKALIFYGYLNYGRGNAELCPTRTEYDDAAAKQLREATSAMEVMIPFTILRTFVDANAAKWRETVAARSAAGRKGRAAQLAGKNRRSTGGDTATGHDEYDDGVNDYAGNAAYSSHTVHKDAKQRANAGLYDNDNDYEYDNDNDNDHDNDCEGEKRFAEANLKESGRGRHTPARDGDGGIMPDGSASTADSTPPTAQACVHDRPSGSDAYDGGRQAEHGGHGASMCYDYSEIMDMQYEQEKLKDEAWGQGFGIESDPHTGYDDFVSWLRENAPYCAKRLRVPGKAEFTHLKATMGSTVLQRLVLTIENRIDIRHRYKDLYATLLNWHRYEARSATLRHSG